MHKEIGSKFGLINRVIAGLLGPVLLWTTRREQQQLAKGKTYEPKTFIEQLEDASNKLGCCRRHATVSIKSNLPDVL